MTRDEIIKMALEAGLSIGKSDGGPYPTYSQLERLVQAAYNAGAAATREECVEKTGEFARKWWAIHCASNKHMETTRKAHDDFCALQTDIRARKGGA